MINVITAEPDFDPGIEAELTAGNYGAYGGSVYMTGPVWGDTVAGSLFASRRQRMQAWIGRRLRR